MILGIDPKVDYAFKLLFGRESSRDLLVHLLNAILKPAPDERIVSLEILNPFNEKDTDDDKLSVVDIKARDQLARLHNVEMQLFVTMIFRPRVLYYWSRLFGEQMKDGTSYQYLMPTHSICIVKDTMFPHKPDHYTRFLLQSDDQVVFSHHIVVHVIELGKFTRKIDELIDDLDRWCYFLKHAATLDPAKVPESLQIGPIKKAMEILTVITKDDIERERYEARLKRQWDEASLKLEREELERELRGLAEQVRQRDEQVRQRDEQVRHQAEQLRLSQQALKETLVGKIHMCQRLLKRTLTARDDLLCREIADLEKLSGELEAEVP